MKSAIVLVIDRLGAGFLGPCGNTWLDTPQFNRLASQSLLCETALADSPDLALAYRAWWTGRHALEPALTPPFSLPQAAHQAGLATVLVTDEPLVAELPDAAAFSERVLLPAEPVTQAADEFDRTGLGKLLLAAIERLRAVNTAALVWIHSRGMAGPWDAPTALRQQFAGIEIEHVGPHENTISHDRRTRHVPAVIVAGPIELRVPLGRAGAGVERLQGVLPF